MSDERLGKLRGKLKEITEHIDEADVAKTDAMHANIEAVARLEKLETELQVRTLFIYGSFSSSHKGYRLVHKNIRVQYLKLSV